MATVSAKCAISVQLSCRASLSWTQVDYSDQKLPYYHNVNKCSNLGSNAKNLIAVHRTSLKSLEICWKANQLRLCSLNAQSLRNKAAEFVCCAISSRADVFAVTEVVFWAWCRSSSWSDSSRIQTSWPYSQWSYGWWNYLISQRFCPRKEGGH